MERTTHRILHLVWSLSGGVPSGVRERRGLLLYRVTRPLPRQSGLSQAGGALGGLRTMPDGGVPTLCGLFLAGGPARTRTPMDRMPWDVQRAGLGACVIPHGQRTYIHPPIAGGGAPGAAAGHPPLRGWAAAERRPRLFTAAGGGEGGLERGGATRHLVGARRGRGRRGGGDGLVGEPAGGRH